MEIEFEIERPELISINDQYMHPVRKTKRGSYVSYFAPSPVLKKTQAFYKEILQEKIPQEFIDQVKELVNDKSCGINFMMEVGLPESELRECDISNFIKAVEDCIVTRTGIDDSRHYTVSAKKSIYDTEDKSWILKISYKTEEVRTYQRINN